MCGLRSHGTPHQSDPAELPAEDVFTAVSYTYGPLLGLFAFGLFTRWAVRDRFTPYLCILSPFVSYGVAVAAESLWGYKVGYEILLFNGLFTFLGLCLLRDGKRGEVHV